MYAISCKEMKSMDSYAIENIGIPSIVLMETAAIRAVNNIDTEALDNFTIICGVGNNGGDGLAIARHLLLKGKIVGIFIVGNLNKGTRDFNINLDILKNMDKEFTIISGEEEINILKESLNQSSLTIDSIFGIGLTRNVEGIFQEVISLINNYSKNTLSIDIPSGLDGDSGKPLRIAVKANKTVTFHLVKKGLINAKDYTGDLIVEPIGIPEKATLTILEKLRGL